MSVNFGRDDLSRSAAGTKATIALKLFAQPRELCAEELTLPLPPRSEEGGWSEVTSVSVCLDFPLGPINLAEMFGIEERVGVVACVRVFAEVFVLFFSMFHHCFRLMDELYPLKGRGLVHCRFCSLCQCAARPTAYFVFFLSTDDQYLSFSYVSESKHVHRDQAR